MTSHVAVAAKVSRDLICDVIDHTCDIATRVVYDIICVERDLTGDITPSCDPHDLTLCCDVMHDPTNPAVTPPQSLMTPP